MARRRELLAELQPLVTGFEGHPWDWGAWQGEAAAAGRAWRGSNSSRWNPGKELSFTPLRPERVVEVRYDHLEGRRFRHTAQFQRWRPDRDPRSCTYGQLEETVNYDLAQVLATPATRPSASRHTGRGLRRAGRQRCPRTTRAEELPSGRGRGYHHRSLAAGWRWLARASRASSTSAASTATDSRPETATERAPRTGEAMWSRLGWPRAWGTALVPFAQVPYWSV